MRKCGILLFLISALLFQGCTLWEEHPMKQWSDATGGEGLERNFWKEVQGRNWVELERHLSGNYVWLAPEGPMTRAAAVDHLKHLQLNDYSLGEFQVELNGSTLVVTYNITMKASFDGQPVPAAPVSMMSVWQQQKSGWMAIAHSTVIPAVGR